MTASDPRVALVLVSHSRPLAEGVITLARQMAGEQLVVLNAAGMGEDENTLGTDAVRILEALVEADGPAGTVVLMDLGSAVLSAEMALDLVEPELRERILLTAAPFVEGTVAAAVAAAGGSPRQAVAAEAARALQPKAEQLGESAGPESEAPAMTGPADHQAEAMVGDPHGLHARPAAQLAGLAARFRSTVLVTNLDNDKGPVAATSLISLMSLAAHQSHRLRIMASGEDAAEAVSALKSLVETMTGTNSAPPAPPEPEAAARPGRAMAVSPGIAVGPVAAFVRRRIDPPADRIDDPAAETARLDAARTAAAEELRRTGAAAGGEGAAIARMQADLLHDAALVEPARRLIAEERLNAAAALSRAADRAAEVYRGLDDVYLRAREADLHDAVELVLGRLLGQPRLQLPDGPPFILLADELSAADALGLDPQRVIGVIDRHGGPTSHAAILLRGNGIPAIAGADALLPAELSEAAFDGASGELVCQPSAEQRAEFERRRQAWRDRLATTPLREGKVRTQDGAEVEIWANVANPLDAERARRADARGIGLLRTEMMFLDRPSPPDEEEQLAWLRSVFAPFAGRPVIVRTLDAGGDKPVAGMSVAKEANPFLGVRGLRLSLQNRPAFETQLRAILRAAVGQEVSIMLPMVSQRSEVEAARSLLEQVHAGLAAEGIPHLWPVPLGIMVEVPAAALCARQLAEAADFFSIGTNDLTQYALAAERGHAALGQLSDPAHPAVLALVKTVAEAAREAGRPVSVCGEAAGDDAAALLLVGLGIGKLSVGAALVRHIAGVVAGADGSRLAAAATEALAAGSAEAARSLISAGTG